MSNIKFICPLCKIVDYFTNLPPIKLIIASEVNDAPEGWAGMTHFGDEVTVVVNASVPFDQIPTVLAHEFAHVLVGQEHEHDTRWEAEFEECMRRMAEALGVNYDTDIEEIE